MKKRKAFTLIEMTIVLFIISLLILVMIPNLNSQRNRANTIHGSAMVNVVQTQVDAYQDEFGNENVTLEKLEENKYLSKKQIQKVNEEKITIENNNVKQG
ncbi:competence type IV pilus major pilin ComGC [Fructilactobacillus vespulae]|uniref:competence type IV pilus major pilin ComGC n=1 Tax=Fructilactobacillus vespulae TaxID=1249630 RepID=UPI0039B46161